MSQDYRAQPDEKILLKFRRHWFMLLIDSIGTLAAAIAPFIIFAILTATGYVPQSLITPSVATFVSAWWLLVVWCALAVTWTDYYLDMWIVTDKRIINIDQLELYHRSVSTWGLDRVQEVTIRTENFIQAMLGYGTVQIQTAGPHDENAHAEGIPNPERVRDVILEAVAKHARSGGADPEEKKLLHAVSHEVKSYLTKDAAALASIAEGDFGKVPQPVKQMAQSALAETRKGVASVMNMLDKSSGAISATPRESKFDLKPVLVALSAEFKTAAGRKNLTFDTALGSGIFQVHGDEVKLRDLVFRNLLENAVRYTPSGGIKIGLARVGHMLRFSVQDSGVGLTPEDRAKLFTEGGRGADSRAVNPESTGFGLSAAKGVVESVGGRIWADSEGRGKGSRFFVELPFA